MTRVDHYVGYPVEAMVFPNEGTTWKFGLLLEGGTVVRFYKNEDVPKESVVAGNGKFIMAVTNYADGSVDVVIGKPPASALQKPVEVVKINSAQGSYSVIKEDDPETEWFPLQVNGPATVPPEDPERLQDGPTEEWVLRARQEREEAEDG